MTIVGDSPEDEITRIRLHKLADAVQVHAATLAEHSLLIRLLTENVNSFKSTSATSEELGSAVELLNVKLDNLAAQFAPIQRAMYWAVAIICGSVLAAMLALVLRATP